MFHLLSNCWLKAADSQRENAKGLTGWQVFWCGRCIANNHVKTQRNRQFTLPVAFCELYLAHCSWKSCLLGKIGTGLNHFSKLSNNVILNYRLIAERSLHAHELMIDHQWFVFLKQQACPCKRTIFNVFYYLLSKATKFICNKNKRIDVFLSGLNEYVRSLKK